MTTPTTIHINGLPDMDRFPRINKTRGKKSWASYVSMAADTRPQEAKFAHALAALVRKYRDCTVAKTLAVENGINLGD